MNILVTGAKGFIGKNLIAALKNYENYIIFQYDTDSDPDLLNEYTRKCNFTVHLAGVNRPTDDKEFIKGNIEFTSLLLENLKKNNNNSPILFSSSVQAEIDSPYGRSKKTAEELLLNYSSENSISVYIYRLTNVFGKWCNPNYNSVTATFCNNIARGIDITVNNPNSPLSLVYIDDVIKQFIKTITKGENHCEIQPVFETTVGELASLIHSFKESRNKRETVDVSNGFINKLYSTYLSYLPVNEFSYPLKTHIDERGSFTEFIRTANSGQVSVNIYKPNITKGNHWHMTKNEKFLIVKGNGVIRFRQIGSDEIIEYNVSDEKPEVVDIPPGYVHNIQNTSSGDMITIMWSNELFDPDNPDTIYEEV